MQKFQKIQRESIIKNSLITDILIKFESKKKISHISLALHPNFSIYRVIETLQKRIFTQGFIPHISLSGIDRDN